MKKIILIAIVLILPFFSCFSQELNVGLDYKLFKPEKYTYNTPLLVILHGYGSNENDLFDFSKGYENKFIVLSLGGPLKAGEGKAWFNLEFLQNKNFKYDYKEVELSRKKIQEAISKTCRQLVIDSSNVILMGFSQGAIMAYDIAFKSTLKIKGVLALSGLLLPETIKNKTVFSKIQNTRFYIAHGYSDNTIDVSEADKVNELFTKNQIKNVLFKKYQMPHTFCGDELRDIKSFLFKLVVKTK
ncbi:MAG: dienelactone hydrolase family protein [Bacteroidetes bacterium]|nr:dienelactone hydrolase family protein [Bacteroidota bacterium]